MEKLLESIINGYCDINGYYFKNKVYLTKNGMLLSISSTWLDLRREEHFKLKFDISNVNKINFLLHNYVLYKHNIKKEKLEKLKVFMNFKNTFMEIFNFLDLLHEKVETFDWKNKNFLEKQSNFCKL
jgi:hypothetical protein